LGGTPKTTPLVSFPPQTLWEFWLLFNSSTQTDFFFSGPHTHHTPTLTYSNKNPLVGTKSPFFLLANWVHPFRPAGGDRFPFFWVLGGLLVYSQPKKPLICLLHHVPPQKGAQALFRPLPPTKPPPPPILVSHTSFVFFHPPPGLVNPRDIKTPRPGFFCVNFPIFVPPVVSPQHGGGGPAGNPLPFF